MGSNGHDTCTDVRGVHYDDRLVLMGLLLLPPYLSPITTDVPNVIVLICLTIPSLVMDIDLSAF